MPINKKYILIDTSFQGNGFNLKAFRVKKFSLEIGAHDDKKI
jgi:hypothetical protein